MGRKPLPADLTQINFNIRHRGRGEVDLALYRRQRVACYLLLTENLPAKLEALASRLDGPLVVLRAEEAPLEPLLWKPAFDAGLRPWRCPKCAGEERRA